MNIKLTLSHLQAHLFASAADDFENIVAKVEIAQVFNFINSFNREIPFHPVQTGFRLGQGHIEIV